ncbi:MAG: N-acetylglucosamine-6-phosphate deacetylase [Usitatibacter sp.]
MTATALLDARILLDEGFVDRHAVLVDGGRIVDIVREDDRRLRHARPHRLGGALLLPGFIDVQVNGGGGVLFNESPTVEGIRAIGAAHRAHGTTAFLPTLISDEPAVIETAIGAVRAAIAGGVLGVAGIHIEGPFINPERKGTHDAARIRGLDDEALRLLASLASGRTLVTLAPEKVSLEAIRTLAAAGVVVSAGHTNATFEQMNAAVANGLTGVTHLFNAMSQLASRAPGMVGAALHHADCWCGIIVDGKHVHPAVLQLALRAKRRDRFMLVTDAMPCVGSKQDHFMMQGKRITVRDGVCVDEQGVLSGSALDMASAVRNAVDLLGVPLEDAARMASTYPAQFLGLGHDLGRIAPGYRASFVAADERMNVRETWIDGVPAQAGAPA